MKNNKGFTLIELLAVILILGVIATIAIGVTGNIINDAKEEAAKSSAVNYVVAIENQIIINNMDSDTNNDILDGAYSLNSLDMTDIKFSGEIPDSGKIEVINGEIYYCKLNIGDYTVIKEGDNYTVEDRVYSLASSDEIINFHIDFYEGRSSSALPIKGSWEKGKNYHLTGHIKISNVEKNSDKTSDFFITSYINRQYAALGRRWNLSNDCEWDFDVVLESAWNDSNDTNVLYVDATAVRADITITDFVLEED